MYVWKTIIKNFRLVDASLGDHPDSVRYPTSMFGPPDWGEDWGPRDPGHGIWPEWDWTMITNFINLTTTKVSHRVSQSVIVFHANMK